MLANNSAYGLAASVWSENINQALHVAPKLKAGVVWINCTNQFDASVGFGGYRESGYGREGGHEGMFEYLKPKESGISKNQFLLYFRKSWDFRFFGLFENLQIFWNFQNLHKK